MIIFLAKRDNSRLYKKIVSFQVDGPVRLHNAWPESSEMKTVIFLTLRPRFILSLVWLLLTLIIPFSNCYGEQTKCKEVPLKLISRQYGEPEPGALGSVCFAETSTGLWLVKVKLSGLTPKESYWLSINAESPDSLENEILGTLRLPGWPPGRFYEHPSGKKEGYWDFKEIPTDTQGNFEETISLPLPPSKYSVKFLVKKSYEKGGKVVLHNDGLVFIVIEVSEPPKLILLSIVLIAVLLIFLIVYRERVKAMIIKAVKPLIERIRCPKPSPVLPPGRVEPAQSPTDDPSPRFTHSPDFRWVCLDGQRFDFTPSQAKVIQILFEEVYQKGIPYLAKDLILTQAGLPKSSQLKDIFKSSQKAWKTLIKRGERKGTYRLNL